MRFIPIKRGFAGSGNAGWDFHRTSLTCPQIKRRSTHRAEDTAPPQGTGASQPENVRCGANRFAAPKKGTSGQQLIASKALVHDPLKRALGQKREAYLRARFPEGASGLAKDRALLQ
jgi:hypothetical protein